MIQRIQSVFLFLISIISIMGLFLTPLADINDFRLPVDTYLKSYLILTASISFLTLLLFRSRKKQLIINRLNFFIQVIALVGFSYILINFNDFDNYLPFLSIPLITLILLLLSRRFIKKDEKLIRSIDRLR